MLTRTGEPSRLPFLERQLLLGARRLSQNAVIALRRRPPQARGEIHEGKLAGPWLASRSDGNLIRSHFVEGRQQASLSHATWRADGLRRSANTRERD